MKNKLYLIPILMVLVLGNCKKDSKDNSTNLAAILLLSQSSGTTLSSTSKKQAAATVNSASSAIGSAASGAQGGGVSFFNQYDEKYSMEKMFANFQKKRIFDFLKAKNKHIQNNALPTSTGGLTCDSSGCTGTMNGTVACDKNYGGGSLTAKNLTTKFTFTSTGSSQEVKGDITLNKCGSKSINFFDFPAQVINISSGTITIDGKKSTNTISSTTTDQTMTITSSEFNLKNNSTQLLDYSEEFTASSSDFSTADGTKVPFSNLKQNMKVRVNSKSTNFALKITYKTDGSMASGSITGDFEDIIDGSIITTGTLSGNAINGNFVFDKTKTYKYSISCTLSATSGDCTSTVK